MRKSWAEYKREARLRERIKERALKDQALPDLRRPFFEYFNEFGSASLGWYADVLGKDWFEFIDDNGIKPDSSDALVQEDLDNASTSLTKAEFLIGLFIDAAADIARDVANYKRHELDKRIAELKETTSANSAEEKKALVELERLKKMRRQLDKQVRWAFPQWKVTG